MSIRKPHLKLTIRSALIVTLLCSLVFAWYSAQLDRHSREQLAKNQIKELNPDASFTERSTMPSVLFSLGIYPHWASTVCAVDVTGRKGRRNTNVSNFAYNDDDLEAEIEFMRQLSCLEEFHASETQLTEKSLQLLGKIEGLKVLNLYNTPMSKEAVLDFKAQHPEISVSFFDN